MIFHIVFATSLLTAFLHLIMTVPGFFRRGRINTGRIVEVFLLHQLCVNWGFGAVLTSIPHILIPDQIAGYIGWEAGSPFQVELGFASLGIAILGVLCIWLRGWFWLAPIVARSVFLLGAAYVHIDDIITSGNLSPGSAGPVLFYDIAIPVLTISLFIAHVQLNFRGPTGQSR